MTRRRGPPHPHGRGDDDDRPRRHPGWPAWIVGAAAVAMLAGATLTARSPLAPRPNVLVLVMDTTRADHCGFDGYPRPTTPHLDEFARDATVFRNAWSPSNWTGSAHASLFTGLRVEHHGFHEGARLYLAGGIETLAERLAAAGYATGCFSNNVAVSSDFGLTRGFATDERLFDRRDRAYPWARETHREAAAWARSQAQDGKPFFLFINDMEPHLPYTPPADVAERFLRGGPTRDQVAGAMQYAFPHNVAYDLSVESLTDGDLGLLTDLYDAELATLDAEVGALLDRLRADGLLDSTLVVIAADHGENLGDHHLIEHGIGLNRSLCHVPLVVRRPGAFDGGRVVDDVVRLEDIYPTVLESCALPVPAGIDGISLTHDLPGRIARAVQPPLGYQRARIEQVYGNLPATARLLRGVESVVDGHFHFLHYEDGAEELFDLGADPGETHDLRPSSPEAASRLSALLAPPISAAPAASGSTEPDLVK